MAETSAVTWGCLGMVVLATLCGVGSALRSCSCDSRGAVQAPAPQRPAPPSVAPARTLDDDEADEAIRMLGRYWPIGQAVAGADWSWAGCSDKTVTFDAMRACLVDERGKVTVALAKVPPTAVAKLSCAKEIEQAHRAYFTGTTRYLDDELVWVDKMKPRLKPLMVNKSRWMACSDAGPLCDKRPSTLDPKYGGGIASINSVACTKTLFQCDAPDNVCWINKVAARLGLGPEPGGGHLLVRATGRAIL